VDFRKRDRYLFRCLYPEPEYSIKETEVKPAGLRESLIYRKGEFFFVVPHYSEVDKLALQALGLACAKHKFQVKMEIKGDVITVDVFVKAGDAHPAVSQRGPLIDFPNLATYALAKAFYKKQKGEV